MDSTLAPAAGAHIENRTFDEIEIGETASPSRTVSRQDIDLFAVVSGVVLGARVPIILTSRAAAERTRMASCAVAALIARARASTPRQAAGV